MNTLYILLTGSIIAATCSLLGTYLILRKMAMVGDAISHAVLPGIVLAYLMSGTRDTTFIVLGAGTVGLLTTFLIEYLHRKARLQEDASIGVIFTSLFALGVILISYYADNIDLDQDCVLYGEIAFVPLDTIQLATGLDIGPRAMWIGLVNFILISFILIMGYKELYITTFDSAYAASIGISTLLWHYILMGMVSFTTVVSFDTVGAILVVALLVVPAATAYLLTTNFRMMQLYAVIFSILGTIGGYYFAVWLDASIAGGMSTIMGVLFLMVLLFSPQQGILKTKARTKIV